MKYGFSYDCEIWYFQICWFIFQLEVSDNGPNDHVTSRVAQNDAAEPQRKKLKEGIEHFFTTFCGN